MRCPLIDNRLAGDYDETMRSGDDYAARIYVFTPGRIAMWNTQVLNYVWAKHLQKEAVWFNIYAGKRPVMKAVRIFEDSVSQWVTEKRDFEINFNKKIKYIDAVAVMTDTDNANKSATGFYSDIYFGVE